MPQMRIGIVAGEPSGDLLGAYLIKALKQFYPDAEFMGVAGEKMCAQGATSLFPIEKISVMGFTEVLSRLFEILSLRRKVKNYFIQHPPEVYIGIDSPDFNLTIENALKNKGIKTVHCNSPTVWAWRKKRIFNIKKAVNLMLVLFPFEKKYYTDVDIPVEYIGHPLADTIPLEYEPIHTFKKIALLPGSRAGEIKYIAPVLIESAKALLSKYPDLQFFVPLVNQRGADQFLTILRNSLPEMEKQFQLSIGLARETMQNSDLIILASGTATLEAMLLKRPMIVVYKGSEISYRIAKWLISIENIALPNILAGKKCVPELIQHALTLENILHETENYMNSLEKTHQLQEQFLLLHKQLKCNAAQKAANAIAQLLNG